MSSMKASLVLFFIAVLFAYPVLAQETSPSPSVTLRPARRNLFRESLQDRISPATTSIDEVKRRLNILLDRALEFLTTIEMRITTQEPDDDMAAAVLDKIGDHKEWISQQQDAVSAATDIDALREIKNTIHNEWNIRARVRILYADMVKLRQFKHLYNRVVNFSEGIESQELDENLSQANALFESAKESMLTFDEVSFAEGAIPQSRSDLKEAYVFLRKALQAAKSVKETP